MARRVIPQQDLTWSTPQSDDPLRVLIETNDVAQAWALQGVLEDAGHQVAWCEGPTANRPCPLVTEGRCSLVHQADVVLHDLRLSSATYGEVLAALRERSPETPVLVAATEMEASSHADRLAGCHTLTQPYGPRGLREAIEDLI
jgi:CheY-like chemotaxis protein